MIDRIILNQNKLGDKKPLGFFIRILNVVQL